MIFNVTARVREHLAKNFGLTSDATDAQARELLSAKYMDGLIDLKTISELGGPTVTITQFSTKYITVGMRAVLNEHCGLSPEASDEQAAEHLLKCYKDSTISFSMIRAILKQSPGNPLSDGDKAMSAIDTKTGAPVTPSEVMATAAKATNGGTGTHIHVKDASARYDGTKSTAVHMKTKTPVFDEGGKQVCYPSQRDFAKAGALFKLKATKDKISVALNEHELALLEEMYHTEKWCGLVGNQWETGITGADRVKSLLNDSTSGGQHVVPEWFDEAAVIFPLLTGELFPFIDLRPVPRGSQVDGASVGNPSVSWGTAEGTAISVFDTASLVGELDTNIHPITCSIHVGRDFLADSVVDIGKVLMTNVGEAMAKELDRVIALGSGTNTPEGIFVASGLGAPTAANGNGGPPIVADYEGLMFAVAKQYRTPANRCVFLANDTTYSRARGIAVGSGDARRVFGMDHSSYMLLEHPFKIQNDVANTQIAYGALSKYRMYRRQAVEMRYEEGGDYLARTNKALLVFRGRYGGRVADPSGFAKITNAQS
jgi:HK97 family phage major capsid protein